MQRIDRTGEEIINNQGLKMKIIRYGRALDIDVVFEDGYIAKNKCYHAFKKGEIKNHNYPNDKTRIGEVLANNQGLKMTILNYRNANDIDVMFEDGYIAHCQYTAFKRGEVRNKNFPLPQIARFNKLKYQRIGETNFNNQGLKMKIIKYVSSTDIDVKFEDGYIVKHTTYRDFKIGGIKSHYYKSFYGVGYLGDLKNIDFDSHCYTTWCNMIRRVYDKNKKIRDKVYDECLVCEEWHNYSNFKRWYDDNYYEIDGETMNLDKDILIKGNKIYSPETCIFVVQRINKLFIKSDKSRGNLPIGAKFHKASNKYSSRMNKPTGEIWLGTYDTPEEAFYTYKHAKEKYIKEVADEYKDFIPQKLYDAMYNWEVEIDD